GEVFCLGQMSLVYGGGQVPAQPGSDPVKIDLDHVRQLALGTYHACVVREDGGVWCWGNGNKPAPVALPGPGRHVECGTDGSCAAVGRGDVMGWPNATKAVPGAIRLGRGGPPSGPIPVLALADVKLRYTPTPAELAGTEWSACLERCDTCRYTLRFQARGEFVA